MREIKLFLFGASALIAAGFIYLAAGSTGLVDLPNESPALHEAILKR